MAYPVGPLRQTTEGFDPMISCFSSATILTSLVVCGGCCQTFARCAASLLVIYVNEQIWSYYGATQKVNESVKRTWTITSTKSSDLQGALKATVTVRHSPAALDDPRGATHFVRAPAFRYFFPDCCDRHTIACGHSQNWLTMETPRQAPEHRRLHAQRTLPPVHQVMNKL